MKKILIFTLLCTHWLTVGVAWAEIADRTSPTHIEADHMQHDDVKKITTATGRVIITKGSIVVRADAVTVRQDAQGNQFITAKAQPKHVVYMRQKREGLNEYIEARARTIERDEKNLIARLIGNASMQRLVGDTIMDSIRGDTLIYNEATETYQAQASTSNTKTNAQGIPTGRVRATIGARTPVANTPAAAPSANHSRRIPLQSSPSIRTEGAP